MIASALRVEIERYAARMPHENPLFVRASEGTLTPVHLAHYLASVKHLVEHSLPHLRRAAGHARAAGDDRLVRHFAKKCGEEAGHELWAEADIQKNERRTRVVGQRARPSVNELIRFIEDTIDEDPVLYLSYILFAEYFVVLLGPAWLALLEERCGIPRSQMTFVGNHAELDRDHAEEAFDHIDELVGDPRKLRRMREVLIESIRRFDAFATDVVTAGDEEIHAERVRAPAA